MEDTADPNADDPVVWLASGVIHRDKSCRSIGVPTTVVGPVALSVALVPRAATCPVCWDEARA